MVPVPGRQVVAARARAAAQPLHIDHWVHDTGVDQAATLAMVRTITQRRR
ncbi:MAG: hypothetical protein M3P18_22105 [Actinomycetota bacterium]|nr:hypothetical protein [Actinomycetota bacterium]